MGQATDPQQVSDQLMSQPYYLVSIDHNFAPKNQYHEKLSRYFEKITAESAVSITLSIN